jgi:hypothetical protein
MKTLKPEEVTMWWPTAQALFPGRVKVGNTGYFMPTFVWVEGRAHGPNLEKLKETIFSRS